MKISNFFKSWKIKLNAAKTEFIVFTHSRVMKSRMTQNAPVFDGVHFEWNDTAKYLGVYLDAKLSFKTHITNCIAKANKAIAALYCIFKKNSPASLHSKLTIYRSYIRPILTYACPVFQNCPKTHFKKLQTFQNKCLRMALSAPYFTRITVLHRESNIPYIQSYVNDITERFYSSANSNKNELISSLGSYTSAPLPFRAKHRLPRAN